MVLLFGFLDALSVYVLSRAGIKETFQPLHRRMHASRALKVRRFHTLGSIALSALACNCNSAMAWPSPGGFTCCPWLCAAKDICIGGYSSCLYVRIQCSDVTCSSFGPMGWASVVKLDNLKPSLCSMMLSASIMSSAAWGLSPRNGGHSLIRDPLEILVFISTPPPSLSPSLFSVFLCPRSLPVLSDLKTATCHVRQ